MITFIANWRYVPPSAGSLITMTSEDGTTNTSKYFSLISLRTKGAKTDWIFDAGPICWSSVYWPLTSLDIGTRPSSADDHHVTTKGREEGSMLWHGADVPDALQAECFGAGGVCTLPHADVAFCADNDQKVVD